MSLTRSVSWNNNIRIIRKVGDSSSSDGKSRDHYGRDVDMHIESEAGIF
jgi:hypothetical protein